MGRYFVRRLLTSLLTVFGTSLLIFFIIRVLPGDMAIMILGPDNPHDPHVVEALRRELGLNQPLLTQYLNWLGGALRLDFGVSPILHVPILDEIVRRIPVTLELSVLAVAFSAVLGIPLGLWAAVRGGIVDFLVGTLVVLSTSMPSFFLALILILFGTQFFPFIPTFDYVSLKQDPWRNLLLMIYPTIALGFEGFAAVAQNTRASVLETLKEPFVATAYAKGLSRHWVIGKHVLKNALIPVVTVLGVQMTYFMGGVIIVETVLGLPGLGSLVWESVGRRDYPTIQALVLFITTLVLLVNLLTDTVYGLVNPRVRYD